MFLSKGYNREYDMGDEKEVITLSIEPSGLRYRIVHNGRILGDSKGYSEKDAKAEINKMCNTLYCCVKYVAHLSVNENSFGRHTFKNKRNQKLATIVAGSKAEALISHTRYPDAWEYIGFEPI